MIIIIISKQINIHLFVLFIANRIDSFKFVMSKEMSWMTDSITDKTIIHKNWMCFALKMSSMNLLTLNCHGIRLKKSNRLYSVQLINHQKWKVLQQFRRDWETKNV